MSTRQDSTNSDRQFHASWLASQRDGPFNVGGLGGPNYGPRYGEFDQFNRSSMVFPSGSTSTADTVSHILRIVAEADHETLLRSRNQAFADLLAVHNGTKEELAALKYVLIAFCHRFSFVDKA